MEPPEKLELSVGVWFEKYSWGTTLEYMERQNDSWYLDMQSSVDIDADTAKRIIAFLQSVVEAAGKVKA